MRDLAYYRSLPWTVRVEEEGEDGEREWVLQVEELPGLAIVGDSQSEVMLKYPAALELFLESYLRDGEEPPLPRASAPERHVAG
jgi:predicted RNase H-like HicB family nuclease